MRTITCWAGAGALLLTLPLPAAAAERTITKREVRTAPPARTHQRLRDVVWDMIVPEDLRTRKPPVNRLDRLWLETKPRGAGVPGLCRYDVVQVELKADEPGGDADTPMHAVGLETTHKFAFLTPPKAPYDEATGHEGVPADTDCRAMKDKNVFTADQAERAYEGVRAWLTLRKDLKDGRPVPLTCDPAAGEKGGCRGVLLALAPDDVDLVEGCGDAQDCYQLYVGNQRLKIEVTGRVIPGPPPGEIVKVRVDGLIVFTHAVVD